MGRLTVKDLFAVHDEVFRRCMLRVRNARRCPRPHRMARGPSISPTPANLSGATSRTTGCSVLSTATLWSCPVPAITPTAIPATARAGGSPPMASSPWKRRG